MKLTDAFQAGTTINVGINSLPAGESCLCNFDHFIVFGPAPRVIRGMYCQTVKVRLASIKIMGIRFP